MNYKTTLTLFIKNINNIIKKKMKYFKVYFAKYIFFLFLGFLLGNLFGSFLNIFNDLVIWNGFIILILLLSEEAISYLTYHSTKRITFFRLNFIDFYILKKKFSNYFIYHFNNYIKLFYRQKNNFSKKENINLYNFVKINFGKIKQYFFCKKLFFIKSLNLFKIGILLGFFVDAFKVGS